MIAVSKSETTPEIDEILTTVNKVISSEDFDEAVRNYKKVIGKSNCNSMNLKKMS
jgi:hypothetical protein